MTTHDGPVESPTGATTKSRGPSRIAWGVMLASAGLLVAAARVVWSSQQEYKAAHVARASGQMDDAIVHFRRAARWYVPGNPYSTRALHRLAEIGATAEKQGHIERALDAYRSMRAAIYSTRSAFVPHAGMLPSVDAHIARLMARLPPSAMREHTSAREREQLYLAQLRASNHRPRVGWAMLALLGFGVWVTAGHRVWTRGFDHVGAMVPRLLLRYAAYFAVGFALFAAGLRFA
jgi:hypothetical protein